jgi:hypothetical protein
MRVASSLFDIRVSILSNNNNHMRDPRTNKQVFQGLWLIDNVEGTGSTLS